jgi:two-component system, OmpR family, response regulator
MSDPLRLLYVDDDADIRTIVRLALSLDPAITVRCAADAGEALAMLDEARPDAILLDVMMPGTDGPALLAQIRARDSLADVPVVFMTAKTRDADVAAYRRMGAADVIPKPFDPITLAARVRAIVAATS